MLDYLLLLIYNFLKLFVSGGHINCLKAFIKNKLFTLFISYFYTSLNFQYIKFKIM